MADEPEFSRPSSPPPREQSPWALAGLGAQFFMSLLLFVYLGSWADRRFDSSPLFLLTGVFVGGGGTFYASYRSLMRRQNAADAQRTTTGTKDAQI